MIHRGKSVYLEAFNLREAPFTLTPDRQFFYEGGQRGEILQALEFASRNTEGVVIVTGEVGTGKTMLSRMLIESKSPKLEIVYVANPAMTRDEIVSLIARELKMKVANLRPSEILDALQKRLIALHARGKQVLVLIDEAHAIPPQTLEEIRLLSNLETERSKLLRIFLVGQDELKHTLATPEMRALRERVTERFLLTPLSYADIANYLSHRLRRAGGDPHTFEPKAVAMLARASEGLSRRVNILADKALLAAYADGARFVGVSHVRQAIQDAAFQRMGGWPQAWLRGLGERLSRLRLRLGLSGSAGWLPGRAGTTSG